MRRFRVPDGGEGGGLGGGVGGGGLGGGVGGGGRGEGGEGGGEGGEGGGGGGGGGEGGGAGQVGLYVWTPVVMQVGLAVMVSPQPMLYDRASAPMLGLDCVNLLMSV